MNSAEEEASVTPGIHVGSPKATTKNQVTNGTPVSVEQEEKKDHADGDCQLLSSPLRSVDGEAQDEKNSQPRGEPSSPLHEPSVPDSTVPIIILSEEAECQKDEGEDTADNQPLSVNPPNDQPAIEGNEPSSISGETSRDSKSLQEISPMQTKDQSSLEVNEKQTEPSQKNGEESASHREDEKESFVGTEFDKIDAVVSTPKTAPESQSIKNSEESIESADSALTKKIECVGLDEDTHPFPITVTVPEVTSATETTLTNTVTATTASVSDDTPATVETQPSECSVTPDIASHVAKSSQSCSTVVEDVDGPVVQSVKLDPAIKQPSSSTEVTLAEEVSSTPVHLHERGFLGDEEKEVEKPKNKEPQLVESVIDQDARGDLDEADAEAGSKKEVEVASADQEECGTSSTGSNSNNVSNSDLSPRANSSKGDTPKKGEVSSAFDHPLAAAIDDEGDRGTKELKARGAKEPDFDEDRVVKDKNHLEPLPEGRLDPALLTLRDANKSPGFPSKSEMEDTLQRMANKDKFAALVELVKSGKTTNREVVGVVLSLLVGGTFDPENNFIILDPLNVDRLLELVDHCAPRLQAEIWSHFTAILRKSSRNLQACTQVGLVGKILSRIPSANDMLADLMVDVLGVLASFSITVAELRDMFGLLQANEKEKWPRHSTKLLRVLQQMPQRHGPDEFFSFPGKKDSAIALPPMAKWPYQNGWTFHCWFRMDPNPGANVDREKPYLFCFRTSKGVGYSGHFLGNALVITSMKVKGKGFQHCVKYDFHPREWYMVTIVFIYNRWSKSELHCYVDGVPASHTDMSWLVNTGDPFDKCYLGCSHDMDPETMFCGQVSSVYLFSEALTANHVAALEYLGPGYKSQFRFENESGILLSEAVKRILYDGKLTQAIVFLYTPVSCDSQLCLESSPKGNVSYFVHNPHALMQNEVKAIITHSIHSILHSIGGVQVLYPLFSQLDLVQETCDGQHETVDYTICASLMKLLCNLLETSHVIQQQFLQSKGFLVISYLLEKSTRHHITIGVLDCFLSLTKYLVSLPTGGPLLKHLLDHILFNPALWIYSSMPVQRKLYTYISTEFVSDAQIYNNIRRVSSVLQTMHTLVYYYWVVNPTDRSGITPKGVDGPRPTREDIMELRGLLLQYIRQLVIRGSGVQDDELQSMINYLATVHEDDNIVDVLDLMVQLMADHPASMVPAFDRKGGVKVIFKLLASSHEMIRVQALKLLGFFLMRSTHKRKHEAMTPYNLFSLITERLFLNTGYITLGTYHVLFEIMTERMSCEIILERQEEPDHSYKLENPLILKVIANLIRQSQGHQREVMAIKRLFLADLTKLCANNKENRRVVLQMSVWQDWLFSMAYIYPKDEEEQSVTETVMSLFRILLHHAVKFEYGGWRVWIDTLAILHSKVSNEDFRIHMAHVYQQYDRMQVTNVSDPQLRKQHPVSTISGVGASAVVVAAASAAAAARGDVGDDQTMQSTNAIKNSSNEDEEDDDDDNDDRVAEGKPVVGDETGCRNEEDDDDDDDESPHKGDGSSSKKPRRQQHQKLQHQHSTNSSNTPIRQLFSPGPRAPPFRIPEFRWSYLHQKLLSDLLHSLEQDVHVWKTHTTKTVIDYVNSPENHVFVVNVTHMISQLADILVTSCGGLLPLLAAATSPRGEVEMLEPNQGLSIEQAVSFLQRIINMTDILVFASSLNFSELEQEKSMNSGGILRQCLRLVCTAAVRNCLECRYRQQQQLMLGSRRSSRQNNEERPDPIQALIAGVQALSKQSILEKSAPAIINPIRDPEKLLQDMDINRLRAVVYRDVEETKQAQFLALAIVYFVSVLMVSKYRDILEPAISNPEVDPNKKRSSQGAICGEGQSLGGNDNDPNAIKAKVSEQEEGKEEPGKSPERSSKEAPGTLLALASDGTVQKSDAVTTNPASPDEDKAEVAIENSKPNLSSPVKESISLGDLEKVDGSRIEAGDSAASGEKASKKASSSPAMKQPGVVAEPSVHLPSAPYRKPGEDMSPTSTGQISSISVHHHHHLHPYARSGDEEDDDEDDVVATATEDDIITSTATIPGPVQVIGAQHVLSMDQKDSGSLTDRLERALGPVAPLLREIFVDFASFLSKTLLGSHGQELLIGGLVTLKQSTSVVELVMLLCSQEWQNSLQKHAGLAFIELVNEGRLLAHATRDHIVRVANEADFILNRMRADDVQKHADFESLCAQSMLERKSEEKMCNHLITSARRRDHVIASKQRDKVINLLTNKHGAWGSGTISRSQQFFWKLDSWEDDSRRRRRFVRNPFGTRHVEATLRAAIEHGATEDAINAAREAIGLHSATLQKHQQQQQVQDTSEEDLSQMDERELDVEFAGPVALSTPCKLVWPGCVVNGTLSITKTELYFEMDEEDPKNKKIDPQVLQYVDYLHGKWHFNEIRAIFSRRYLLQNVAMEIFMASRTAVMFAFQDFATVKKVVNVLPRVGVGVKYGLPQTRRVSLASPKQIFKMSNMTQKWQRREITNFDYLMYLNTVAGRTYCDLNQYPVYPWVIVNYESDELDLNLASNYRDLSKPIGALNPTRKSFFEERYNGWDSPGVPPFHYGTHYSTAAFVLNWLIRVEPFTTFFLNLQGGKFDHADRTFHSVLQAWKNCQRDTSDVKELIPEFYYLSDMFVNTNSCCLGTNEGGVSINNVVLPPWAKSPEDFVRIMRMALESEIVSIQLHQWIDLIFGYKQRGPEAIRSTNVFYYLTYEGSINLESVNDPVLREAIENQIQSFGQTPSQLLTEPHPPRSSPMNLSPMMFTTIPEDVCMIMKFLSNSPVTHIGANTHPAVPIPAVITVTCNYNFAVNKWNHAAASSQSPSPGYADKSEHQAQLPLTMDQLLVAGSGLNRRSLGDNFDQRLRMTHSSFVAMADNRHIIAVGFWDKSFRVFSTDTAKIVQTVHGHFGVVTCIGRSECSISQDCYVVTGSKDCTVMVWHWVAKQQCILGDNGSLESATPKATLTGHKSEVTCVIVSAELGVVVSGSLDGPVLIHTNTGDLLRSLDPPNRSPPNQAFLRPHLLSLNREGYVVVSYEKGGLCSFTINGKIQRYVTHNDNLQCMIMNRDGQYLMVGGDNGVVEVWRSYDLTVLYSFPTCDSSVRSLALSHDQKFLLAGLATGCLIVFNIDFNRWNPEFQDKYQ